MDLMGAYPSQLTGWHKDQLLALIEKAIAAGDYGGGKLVDSTSLSQLNQQASDFSNLPAVPSGSRALVESILYPVSLLAARYAAIAQERDAFMAKMQAMLGVLVKDTELINQLIAAAEMETWVSRQGPLDTATKWYLDFAATHGSVAVNATPVDPETGAVFPAPVSDVTFLLNPVDGFEEEPLRSGIGLPPAPKVATPSSVDWSSSAPGAAVETSFGPDWAKLSLLEPSPVLRYGSPALSVILPKAASVDGLLAVRGVPQNSVSLFVRVFFTPRQVTRQLTTGAPGIEVPISNYRIASGDIVVTSETDAFAQGLDYQIDAVGRFLPLAATANRTLTLIYSEMFPCYQSSYNQQDWSPVVMLDPERMNPEGSNILHLFSAGDGWFPLLDEGGQPTGLTFKMLALPSQEYLLRVDIPTSSQYGVSATLDIEMAKACYLNGFHLAPASNYPAVLESVSLEGMTADSRTTVWSGTQVIDRALTIRFDRQLVHRVHLAFRQPNYILNEHVVDPADRLRREALVALQGSLPYALRRVNVTPSQWVSGAQYDFGFTELRGEDWQARLPSDRGVFLSGPYAVDGTPELLRFDAEYAGDVKFYLSDAPFDQNETLAGSSQGEIEITPGVAFSYTPPATSATLSKVEFTVKFVLRDPYAVVERFLFQVTHVR